MLTTTVVPVLTLINPIPTINIDVESQGLGAIMKGTELTGQNDKGLLFSGKLLQMNPANSQYVKVQEHIRAHLQSKNPSQKVLTHEPQLKRMQLPLTKPGILSRFTATLKGFIFSNRELREFLNPLKRKSQIPKGERLKKLRKYARFVKGNSAAQQILAQALIDGALEEFWTIYSASTELRLSWGKDLGFISEVYQDAQGEARPLSLPFMVMLGLKKAGEQHTPMICLATKILVLISQRAPETLHTTVGSDLLTALHRNCPMDGSQTSEVNLIEFSEKFHDFEPAQQKKFKTFLSSLLNQQQQKGSQSRRFTNPRKIKETWISKKFGDMALNRRTIQQLSGKKTSQFSGSPIYFEDSNDQMHVAMAIENGILLEYEELLKEDERFATLRKQLDDSCSPQTGINAAHMVISGLNKLEFTADKIDMGFNCLRRIKRLAPSVFDEKIQLAKDSKPSDLVQYASSILPMYIFNLIKNRLSDLVSEKKWTFDNPRKKIKVVPGDITTTKADVIVNAAKTSLMGGGGVDGAIHEAAGPELIKECEPLAPCPPGEVRSTGPHDISCCKRIFHTVGPKNGDGRVLKDCYINCLEQLKREGFKSIAFCCIGTGVYRFPYKEAAMIAFYTVWDWLNHPENREIEKVTFVCDGKNLEEYQLLLGTPHP